MSMPTSRRTGRLLVLIVVLLATGTVIAYYGTRGGEVVPATVATTEPALSPSAGIVLPHEEPVPPEGPHRRVFQTSCTICHSTRLVFNQPLLTEKKWTEVVDKMIKAYGAPVTKEQEANVIEYLSAVHAPKQIAAK